jgi:hypothetical protein
MPKKIIKYQCGYCNAEFIKINFANKHEEICVLNPNNEPCYNCLFAIPKNNLCGAEDKALRFGFGISRAAINEIPEKCQYRMTEKEYDKLQLEMEKENEKLFKFDKNIWG